MIRNDSDVRQWAEMIVAANGDKFTPLTKGEQFVIAKYILGSGDITSPSVPEVAEQEKKPVEEEPNDKQPSTGEQKQKKPPVKMTRGVAFHFSGYTAQQAFDKFLEEAKGNSDIAKVMDFSTGRQSTDAAFAYWLNEVLNVTITD